MRMLEQIVTTLPEGMITESAIVCDRGILMHCGGWGLSSTFRDPRENIVAGAESLIGVEGKKAATYAFSDRLIEASWGMATVNALLQPTSLDLCPLNAASILAQVGRGRRVASIGAFHFLEKLRPLFKSLEIIDHQPWRGEEGVKAARKILPQADVVAVTGSSFINHTAERILGLCPRAYVIVLGPTTPLTPLLFEYGVDAICGTIVTDSSRACCDINRGASFRNAGGLTCVTAFRDRPPNA